jgi:hypothetical protein
VSPSLQKQINEIYDAFDDEASVTTEDVIMWRGVNMPDKIIDTWEGWLKAGLPGTTQSTGFVSASLASKAAFSHENVMIEYVVRKGTPTLGVAAIAGHGENEVLLRHGQAVQILSIDRSGSQVHVTMATL